MSAAARVRTTRGIFEKFVAVPKGEPENFVSLGELTAKFDSLVSPYLSKRRRDDLANALLNLEQAMDISAVLRLTQPDQSISGRRRLTCPKWLSSVRPLALAVTANPTAGISRISTLAIFMSTARGEP